MGYYHLGQPARELYERAMPWFTAVPTPPRGAMQRAAVRAPGRPLAPRRWTFLPSFLGGLGGSALAGLGGLLQVVRNFLSGGGKILSLGGRVAMMIPGGQLIGAGAMIAGGGMEFGGAVLTVAESVAERNKVKAAVTRGDLIPQEQRPYQKTLTELQAEAPAPEAPPPPGSPLSPITVSAPMATTGTVAAPDSISLDDSAALIGGFCIPASPPGNPGYVNFIQSSAELASYTALGWSIPSPWGNAGFPPPCAQPGGMVNAGVASDGTIYTYDAAAQTWKPYVPPEETPVVPYEGQVGYDPILDQWKAMLGGRWQPVSNGSVGIDPAGATFILGAGGGGAFIPSGTPMQANGAAYYQHPSGPLESGPGVYNLDPGTVATNPQGGAEQWTGSGWSALPVGSLASDPSHGLLRWNGTTWEPSSLLDAGTTARSGTGTDYVWDGSKWVTPAEYAAMLATGAPAALVEAQAPAIMAAGVPGALAEYAAGVPGWVWIASAGLLLFSLSRGRMR